MQNFDIVTVRVFLSVARKGSIGAAAKTEHLAASAVSRRISDLEYHLGVTLLRRTPHGATLTAAGKAFSNHCEKILQQFADARVEVKKFSDGEAGELRIAAVTSAINGRLPDAMAQFQGTHPSVEVTLNEVYSSDGVRLLREDLADLAIIADTADTRSFDIRPYKADPVWVIAADSHPLFAGRKEGESIPFKATLGYEHLSFHEGGVLDDLLATAAKKAKHTLPRRISVTRFDSLRRCAEAGLGIGFLRRSAVRPHLKEGGLTGAPLEDDWADRSLVCAFPKAQNVSATVAQFLEVLNTPE